MYVLVAGLRVRIKGGVKMAQAIVTIKIMPDSPEVDLEKVKESVEKELLSFETELGKYEIQPVAFGLKALIVYFVVDESKGSVDPIEEALKKIDGVNSVEVTDVRRALG